MFKYKETICVVLSAVYWYHTWCIKIVFVYYDNTAAVAILNKDTAKSQRGFFWLSALYNFHIKASMLQGTSTTFEVVLPIYVLPPIQSTFLLFPMPS